MCVSTRHGADGSVAVMILNMNNSGRTVDLAINGDPLADEGLRYVTDGDSPLASTAISGLGNAFSTSISGRTMQLFVLPALDVLPGDFNNDNIVDAADYTVWRDNQGASGLAPYEAGDATGDGSVTIEDYHVWRSHYGQSTVNPPPFSPVNGAVPEATALTMLLLIGMAAVGGLFRCRRPGHQTTGLPGTCLAELHQASAHPFNRACLHDSVFYASVPARRTMQSSYGSLSG